MSTQVPPTLGGLVTDYLKGPSPETLARLRTAILTTVSFDPDLNLAAEVAPHLQAGEYERVAALVTERMPGAALCPAAHRSLAISLEKLGHREAARREETMAQVSVSSVLTTGDGSRQRPWSVLRVADEYDVMGATGVMPTAQASLRVDGRWLDRHETSDGREVWFVLDRG